MLRRITTEKRAAARISIPLAGLIVAIIAGIAIPIVLRFFGDTDTKPSVSATQNITIRDIHGNGTTVIQKQGMDPNEVAELVAKIVDGCADPFLRAGEEIGRLKTELTAAIRRAEAAEARGDRPEAADILQELRKTGDTTRLQELLITDRDAHRDSLIDRNRELAAVAFLRGDMAVATQAVDEILALTPTDLDALNRKGKIQYYTGQLDQAESSFNRVLHLAQAASHNEALAVATNNLGIIYQLRGDLDRATELFRKSLEIDEKLGRLDGMAATYGNLGIIYGTSGDLDRAEEMLNKAVDIFKKLGRPYGMAAAYSNLGIIYRTRGDLGHAEKIHNKALDIFKKLERSEGISASYGSLGVVYYARGDFDRAEEMFNKALELDKELGHIQGMAVHYTNLSIICGARGDRNRARDYAQKALSIFTQTGITTEIEKLRPWLRQLD